MISNCVLWIFVLVLTAVGDSRQDCVLPLHPTHGRHVPYDLDCPKGSQTAECQGVPGTSVYEGWTLFLKCDFGYKAHNNASDTPTVCSGGDWSPPLSSCIYIEQQGSSDCELPSRPAYGSYETLAVECGLNSTPLTPAIGSLVPLACVLVYNCNPGYTLSQPDNQSISICYNSAWQPPPHTFSCSDDSLPPTVPPTSKPVSSGCALPPGPTTQKFCPFRCKDCSSLPNGNCSYLPGTTVKDVALKVQCRQGYGLPDNQQYIAIVCLDGNWFPEIPDCQKLCPPLESDSVYPHCMYGNTRVDCSKPMLPDTTAVYQCRPSYSEYPSLTAAGVYKRTLTCKQNGRWSYMLPECKPDCGISKGSDVITPTIVNGRDTPLGIFPWHVGLYTKSDGRWKHICGGSLISRRLVLTAAHCVITLEPRDLRVAMGKYYRSWDRHEEFAVTRNVSRIRLPTEYRGAVTTYAWDIALVMLQEMVQVTSFVMPVCRDVTMRFDITKNVTGYVVGWGKTDPHGSESETLLSNTLTILDNEVCRRRLPQILAFDKFCGNKNAVSVAEKGDSGGGMTAVFGGLHYLFGIVSVKHNNLTVFTNISWTAHRQWLEREIVEFNKIVDYS